MKNRFICFAVGYNETLLHAHLQNQFSYLFQKFFLLVIV